MSEYRSYEFVALDRPLTAEQMAELRAISTRAEITPTRFWNEYQWGDLKADPRKLVERYFDAHLYFTNWGTRRLILRLPKACVDANALRTYFPEKLTAQLHLAREHVLLDLTSDIEEPEYDEESQGSLAVLASLRTELMSGDLRPAYLAWLLAVQADDINEDAPEPPVPAGLATLSAAQQSMVDFLRIDEDLLEAARAGSAELAPSDGRFRIWVMGLPEEQKDKWLLRAVQKPDLALGAELLRVFRSTTREEKKKGSARTVADLHAVAEKQREVRAEAMRARKKKAQQAAEREKQRRLDDLARDADGTWRRLEELVATSAYEEAVKLAKDLRDLSTRKGEPEAFPARFEEMRKRQSRRRGFFDRWRHAITAAER